MYAIQDVKGDGSCFYRSVYHSAKRAGCLGEVAACLGAEAGTEIGFVRGVRGAIADRIIAGDDGGIIRDVYDNLKGLNVATFRQVMKGMPRWLSDEFTKMPAIEEEFRGKFAAGVREAENWASEIDVTIFKNMFSSCVGSVRLVILNNIPDDFVPEAGKIYVWNIDEVHYKYVVPEYQMTPCPPGTIRNPETGKCVKIDGKIGKSIISRSRMYSESKLAKTPSRRESPRNSPRMNAIKPRSPQLHEELAKLNIKSRSPQKEYTGRITRSRARTMGK